MRILTKVFKSIHILRLPILSFIILITIFFLAGCSTLELNSNWKDRDIVIDGKSNDWLGTMYYFEYENISVGVLNDDNYVYICMIAEEPLMLAQVMGQGFTLWFDPNGRKEKTLGVRFPLGRQGMQVREMLMSLREEEPDQEKIREHFEKSLTELEILGPRKDEKKRIPVKEVKGIEIAVDASGGLLVYELKVPLLPSEQHPYAVRAEAGDLIGIGMEIPKIDMNAMRERMGDRRPEGIGMGGGPPGGMGKRDGSRPKMPNGLKIWVAVQLASDNKSIPESLS